MFIGSINTIPSIVNLPGQSKSPIDFTDEFAFRFGANPNAEFFTVGATSEFDLLSTVTVSFWFTVDNSLWSSTANETRGMVDKLNSGKNAGWGVYFQNFSTQGVRVPFICATTGNSGVGLTDRRLRYEVPAADTAYHYAFTYNSITGEYKSYINGQAIFNTGNNVGQINLANNFPVPAPINNTTADLVVGKDTTTSTQSGEFKGKMDEISIWNTDLSYQSINNIYNFSVNGDLNQNANVSNLIAWYRCGENSTWSGSEWQMPNSRLGATSATDVASAGLIEADRVAGIIV